MSRSLIKLLTPLGTRPTESSAFQEWTKQADVPEFFAAHAASSDVLLYASIPHLIITSFLVKNEFLDKHDPKELKEWGDVGPWESWSIWHTGGKEDFTISEPLAGSQPDLVKQGEQLLWVRSFEGLHGDKTYFELNHKFSHLFEIHYIPERQAYCRYDRLGDLEQVVERVPLPQFSEEDGASFIYAKRSVLNEYLAITDSSLVLCFDFNRYQGLGNWNGERTVTEHDNLSQGLFYTLTYMAGGSYSRGACLVKSPLTKAQAHTSMYEGHRNTEYASFIVNDWKHGKITDASCDPKKLGNYFVKSDLPFETTPAFFRSEVLLKYKNDSDKYRIGARSITCRSAWHLKSYDINEEGQVHAYLIDLSKLPYEEQLYWKVFNEAPKALISRRAFMTDFEGSFDTSHEPLTDLKRVIHNNLKGVGWWSIDKQASLDKIQYPVAESIDDWAREITKLDQLIVEGFSHALLKQRAKELKRPVEANFQSLKLIEEILIGLGFEEDYAKSTVAPLRNLHNIRNKLGAAHRSGSDGQTIKRDALKTFGSFRKHFEHICDELQKSLETIIEALA